MIKKKEIRVLDFINNWVDNVKLDLKCVAGRKGMHNAVAHSINRPGLALTGQFIEFGKKRIQLFGRGEVKFLYNLQDRGEINTVLEQFFSQEIAACFCSHIQEQQPPEIFLEHCEKNNVPLFFSSLTSSVLSANIFRVLNDLYAPTEIKHGVFMEVHDLGVLIAGDSGIGKSEIALELIERNRNRLIADDVVMFKKVNDQLVEGTAIVTKQYQHNLEIRGLGLVNVSQIYGIDTTLDKKELHLVIQLNTWDESMEQRDRLESESFTDILGVQIPQVNLFVKAGRNVALLIEIAAIKFRLIDMGFHGKENPYLW